MLQPVKFGRVTKKLIKSEISKLKMDDSSNKFLFGETMAALRKKKLFLKDMKAITFFAGKNHMEIGFYSKDSYFSKYLDSIRI